MFPRRTRKSTIIILGCLLLLGLCSYHLIGCYQRNIGTSDFSSVEVLDNQVSEIGDKLIKDSVSESPIGLKTLSEFQDVLKHLTAIHRNLRSAQDQYNLLKPIQQVQNIVTKYSKLESAHKLSGPQTRVYDIVDVCPEVWTTMDLSGGYPFFYTGFDMVQCDYSPKLEEILTIVIKMNDTNATMTKKLISSIHQLHPSLKIVLGVSFGNYPHLNTNEKVLVQVVEFKSETSDTDIWNKLIGQVTTKYILIGRGIVHFTWHSRVERLIRELNNLPATVVGGSFRLMSGQWSYGCEQTIIKNYTVVYKKGYDWSLHECMICDQLTGPFMTSTATFKWFPLPLGMSEVSGFSSWFLTLKANQHSSSTCPDSMFFVKDSKDELNKDQWKGLARQHQIAKIKLSSGVTFQFDCQEMAIACGQQSGISLSPCCMEELSTMIKTLLKLCKESGSLCELQEGTLLGAVKFNGVLPWERDADITFHSSNFSAIANLKSKLADYKYTLEKDKEPWCCVDGVEAGGIFVLKSSNWHIEMYGQHLMDSEKLLLDGIVPTTIDFDGQLVNVPTSPGLFSRNRYGREIYKHAQHWSISRTAQKSGWAFYTPGSFSKCHNSGHHSCLDQYLADGNIQFTLP